MAEEITLQTVINHAQHLHEVAMGELKTLKKLGEKLDQKIDRTKESLTLQIDGIDDRLNIIEIAIVEQKHEARIRKLELSSQTL